MQNDELGFIPGLQKWFNIFKSTNMIQHSNKMRDKNQIIISVDTDKAPNNIQHPFYVKKYLIKWWSGKWVPTPVFLPGKIP